VRRDQLALIAWEGRGTAKGVTELLIAVAIQLRPNPQGAFEGADPGPEFDALGSEEAALQFAVVRDVAVSAPEAVDDLAEGRGTCNILIDDVMDSRSARRMGLPGRTKVPMALVMPPPRTMSTLAISMMASEAGSLPVVSMSMTRIKPCHRDAR
jgi:hypothetical protein